MVIIIQYKMTDIKTEYDRLKFKSYYNDAIMDVLTLKKECNLNKFVFYLNKIT